MFTWTINSVFENWLYKYNLFFNITIYAPFAFDNKYIDTKPFKRDSVALASSKNFLMYVEILPISKSLIV